ncbi:response regulator, partial [Thermodesulfobacteriota bacterium]
ALETIVGYTLKEVAGQSPFTTERGIYGKQFYHQIWETVRNGNVWTGHLTFKTKEGSLFEFDQTISPIRDASGTISGYVAIGRDITNELRLEKDLRQSQKIEAIGTLAGGIAHDFNNILTAIVGYTGMSLYTLGEDSREYNNLKQVLSAARRATDLVQQILTFSRQSEQKYRPLSVVPIVKEALRFLRASIPSSIEFRQKFKARADTILTDPTQIHQILMNLCSNAAHAMRETGGMLQVTVEDITFDDTAAASIPDITAGHYLAISVSDTGHGMDLVVVDRIFDPYFTTKGKGEGTGLGLSVVHGIVKSHKGAIAVDSTINNGTTFVVYLPIIYLDIQAEEKNASPIPGGNECLLIVDDEKLIVDMTKLMLKQLGYKVYGRTGSHNALEMVRKDPYKFDLIITDKIMPRMNGFEFAQAVHKLRPDIPILLFTGYSDISDAETARSTGIAGIVMKPIITRDLAEKIRQAFAVNNKID